MSAPYTGPDYIYSTMGTSWGIVRDKDGSIRSMTMRELDAMDQVYAEALRNSLLPTPPLSSKGNPLRRTTRDPR